MAGEKKTANRHKSKLMIRLPEEARPILMEFKESHGAPYTVTLMWALSEYRDRHGKKNKSRKSATCG